MKYYQSDFLSYLPIEDHSIDLFISSVPLKIISDECGLLFGILNRYMTENGFILIDAPAGYTHYDLSLWHGASAAYGRSIRIIL